MFNTKSNVLYVSGGGSGGGGDCGDCGVYITYISQYTLNITNGNFYETLMRRWLLPAQSI